MAICGYSVMRTYVFGLVDEVWDCGETLLVRNKGREADIALADCVNLNYTGLMNPPRITLMLRIDTEFGTEIAFVPTFHQVVLPFFPFSLPRVAQELVERIDAARRASGK